MALYEAALEDVKSSPEGAHIGAFFDFDGTICHGFSATSFLSEQIRKGEYSPLEVIELVSSMTLFLRKQLDFSSMMSANAELQTGKSVADYKQFAEDLFESHIAKIIYPESRAIIREHIRKGHTVAIISSATRYQLEPAARDLGVKHLFCTEMVEENGRFTGEVVHPTCYGPGKVLAAEKLAKEYNIDFQQSFFYSDSDEDMPLLEKVGKPRPLNPNKGLTGIAEDLNWPIQRFSSRGRPKLNELVRSTVATGSIAASFAATLPIKWLTGDNRLYRNAGTSFFGYLSSALTNVSLDVSGQEHLLNRPAVVIINHQSKADIIVVANLLKEDLAGVGKMEIKKMPLVGKALEIAGAVYIDRKNSGSAIEAMKPLVDVIQNEKRSVVIAPEGTRSVSPMPGKFKKGAFHIAIQAGVPILPVVIHNAIDVAPKGQFIFKPATVKVEVLPPIDPSTWNMDKLEQHIEAVRQLYIEKLDVGYVEEAINQTAKPKAVVKKATPKKAVAKKAPAKKAAPKKRAATKKAAVSKPS